jgi:U3 small nucleolar RNA-associated protein 12
MCLDRWGSTVATAGHDKSIRLWQKTDEQLFLEEERERETEEQYERELIENQNRSAGLIGGDEDNHQRQQESELAAPHLKTLTSLKAGERIMEAIDLAESEREKWDSYRKSLATSLASGIKSSTAKPEPNLVLKALGVSGPEWHLLKTIEKVRSADLDEALLVLPFGKILTLMQVMEVWLKNGWNIAITTRILIFLLKSHHTQITANQSSAMSYCGMDNAAVESSDGGPQFTLKPLGMLLESIRQELRRATIKQKEQIGFNLAGLKFIRSLWEQEHITEFLDWEKEIEGKVVSIGSSGKKKSKRK